MESVARRTDSFMVNELERRLDMLVWHINHMRRNVRRVRHRYFDHVDARRMGVCTGIRIVSGRTRVMFYFGLASSHQSITADYIEERMQL